MANLIYSVIASLDGYVEDRDGQVRLGGAGRGSARVRERPRAAGRDVPLRAPDVRDDGLLGEPAEPRDEPPVFQDYARIWQSAEKIVFSRTLEMVTSDRTRIERDFDPEAVRRLKAAADHDLTVGGAELAAQAIEAGLVDEFQLFLVPVVVGGGKRALPDAASAWISSCSTSAGSATARSTCATAWLRDNRAVTAINVFTRENPDGRIDVEQRAGIERDGDVRLRPRARSKLLPVSLRVRRGMAARSRGRHRPARP